MSEKKVFVATPEAKAQAKQLRLFAILAWIVAIGIEVFAILKLISNDTLVWLLVAVGVILALSITGSLLWKRANKKDPASEKDKFRFFVQNQLGALIAALAFLPLLILVLLNKNLDGKTKGIAGAAIGVAFLAASIVGIDFNPPSIEKYTEQINAQTSVIEQLNGGVNQVYWTPAGNKYHIFEDCQHIRNSDVSSGTVEEAFKARNIGDSELCKTCQNKAEKNLGTKLNTGVDAESETEAEIETE